MRRKETIKRTCVVCKKEFNALRTDAKTCSSACRARHSRTAKDKLIQVYQRHYINHIAETYLKDGNSVIRMESLRNGLGKMPPAVLKTDKYVFRKKDQQFWAIEPL